MSLRIRRVTFDLWPALEALFGRSGASNGCWCMYWLLGPEYHRRDRALNRQALRESIETGRPPGLLAFDGDVPVGWARVTPRSDLVWLAHFKAFAPVDDQPVWSLSCLYVRRTHRRQGVSEALITAAIGYAKAQQAPALEAYPVEPPCLGHPATHSPATCRRSPPRASRSWRGARRRDR
jgi:GNAT superfamily N-acetyltransferase